MPSESEVRRSVRQALEAADAQHFRGQPSVETAERLFARVHLLHRRAEVGGTPDFDSVELACLALHLQPKAIAKTSAKPHRPTLKDRTAQSVDLLLSMLRDDAPPEATVRLLNDMARRLPQSTEARLLSDAINLEDFGILGLVSQFAGILRQGHGAVQLVDAADKREQYGYWDARLKDGFHFEASRKLAQQRLGDARRTIALLGAELREDAE